MEVQEHGKTAYRLERQLGSGDQAKVWSAKHIATGNTVVVRELSNLRFSELRRAFVALRNLESAALPCALDLIGGNEVESAWLVTTWIEGESLRDAKPGEWLQVLAELRQVAEGLAAIHSIGLHHGDISANNVIRGSEDKLVLTDFGSLGQLGCGTPGYLAPEVLGGGGGPASDVFSWASLLCFRLFGQVPWEAPDSIVRIRKSGQVSERISELRRSTNLDLPEKLLRLLSSALHPDPTLRISDANVLLGYIDDVLEGGPNWEDLLSNSKYWRLPSNWVYRGLDLRGVAERLLSSKAPKLVVVTGPPGSGRSRAVQEIIQICQEHAKMGIFIAASECPTAEDPERFRRGYVEAWLDNTSDLSDVPILGLGTVDSNKEWTSVEQCDVSSALSTMLIFGTFVANRTLVIACESKVAAALESIENNHLEIVRLQSWSAIEICEVVKSCGVKDQLELWANALLQLTGGWPGRIIEVIAICAANNITDPDLHKMEQAISGRSLPISLDLAKRVLRRSWGERGTELPAGFCSEDGWPFAWAIASAQRSFEMSSLSLVAYATQYLEKLGNLGIDGTVQLLIDAEHTNEIERAVADSSAQDIDIDRNIEQWILDKELETFSDQTVVAVLRQLIRKGRSEEVVELALESSLKSKLHPACRLELARALQQLGRSKESLVILSEPIFDSSPYVMAKLALRWRGLCDLSQAGRVIEESKKWREPLMNSSLSSSFREDDVLDCSLACTWVAYAAWLTGEETRPWIELANSMVSHQRGRRAHSVAARVEQIRGAIAWSNGQSKTALLANRKAYEHYCAADEENGRLLILGNLAAMSIPLGEIGYALVWGRKAVRDLCTRNVIQPLSAALVNCVQALLYIDAFGEAETTIEGVRQVLAVCNTLSSIDTARIAWLSSKVQAQRLFKGSSDAIAFRSAIQKLEESAILLRNSGAFAESVDAWLELVRCCDKQNDRTTAWSAWRRAFESGAEVEDFSLRVEILLEALNLGPEGIPADEVRNRLPPVDEVRNWIENGQLLLAHKYLKTMLLGQRFQQLPLENRRKITIAFHHISESLMNKVHPLDRDPFRENLLGSSSSSEPIDSLGELIRGIENPLITQQNNENSVKSVSNQVRTSKSSDSHWPRLMCIYRRLAREHELKTAINHVLEAVLELTGAERGVVIVYDSDGNAIEEARQLSQEHDVVAFSRSIIEQVRQSAEPVLSVDAARDQRFDQSKSVHHLRLRSVLAVPLFHQSAMIGVIYVDHRLRRGAFDESDLAMIEDFANLAALALSHTRINEQLRKQAKQLHEQRCKLEELLDRREIEVQCLRESVRSQEPERMSFQGMIGGSAPMQEVYRKIERLANTHVSVAIFGESGTGKELVARALHQSSDRCSGPFVAENCGAIPESLIESVLFGHARGSFTGADQARPGLFEAANGGTIFLDEISEMPIGMQTKLLRVLQEGEVRRIGESANRKLNVRVITASNRDLKELVQQGKFRQDLYYRICVVRLELPPLRERSEDIKALCEHLFSKFGRTELRIETAAMRRLMRYAWPGNVRELENEVQRWIALCEQRVEVHDLSPAITDDNVQGQDPDDLAIKPRVAALERELIQKAFLRTRGNQTQAAELLGLSRFGLQKKLRRLNESTDTTSTKSSNISESVDSMSKAEEQ